MLAPFIVINVIVSVVLFVAGFKLTSVFLAKLPTSPTYDNQRLLAGVGGIVTAFVLPIALKLLLMQLGSRPSVMGTDERQYHDFYARDPDQREVIWCNFGCPQCSTGRRPGELREYVEEGTSFIEGLCAKCGNLITHRLEDLLD